MEFLTYNIRLGKANGEGLWAYWDQSGGGSKDLV